MAKGTIKRWMPEKGFGFIRPDAGGDDVRFYADNLRDGTPAEIKEGIRVQYELRARAKQPTTQFFSILAEGAANQAKSQALPETEPPAVPTKPPYRFLNPYNFVRSLRERQTTKGDFDTDLLGRCQPPPHDRWVGLSGKIVCEVEAVTPLFISDSEAHYDSNKNEQIDHRTYKFFEYDFGKGPEPALPASSLRGMVRSVFEAVTNSCFSSFQNDDPYPLEYRKPRAPDMYPGRIVKIEHDSNAWLEVFDCTPENFSQSPTLTRTGAVRQAYPPKVFNSNTEQTFNPSWSRLPVNAHDGMRVAALVKNLPTVHNSRRFQSFFVEEVVPVSQFQTLKQKDGFTKVFGWLHLTGPNIENKHDERLFFRWDDNKHPDPLPLDKIAKEYLAKASKEVIAEYNHHLKEYWERNQRDVEKLGDKRWPKSAEGVPHPSTFIQRDRKLQEGDLVYVQFDQSGEVVSLRPVSMPRVRYRRKRQELLMDSQKRCHKHDKLCPACRTFGWVHQANEGEIISRETNVAYAGRVRFSHGQRQGELKMFEAPIPLAILSSPKPTTTRFYLKPRNDKLKDGIDDSQAGYDNDDNVLRGRKFYRHQGHANDGGFWRQTEREYRRVGENSDQNRTVANALLPESKFTFTLQFENLAAVELGALLWSLELDGNAFHRLGFAKPLGLGSVRLKILNISLLDFMQRYDVEWLSGEKNVPELERNKWINKFKQAMSRAYKAHFEGLAHVKDLVALLSGPISDLPIHYPRSEERPNPDGKNFEWFMGNKRKAKLVLEMPGDEEGFPRIKKNGDVID